MSSSFKTKTFKIFTHSQLLKKEKKRKQEGKKGGREEDGQSARSYTRKIAPFTFSGKRKWITLLIPQKKTEFVIKHTYTVCQQYEIPLQSQAALNLLTGLTSSSGLYTDLSLLRTSACDQLSPH